MDYSDEKKEYYVTMLKGCLGLLWRYGLIAVLIILFSALRTHATGVNETSGLTSNDFILDYAKDITLQNTNHIANFVAGVISPGSIPIFTTVASSAQNTMQALYEAKQQDYNPTQEEIAQANLQNSKKNVSTMFSIIVVVLTILFDALISMIYIIMMVLFVWIIFVGYVKLMIMIIDFVKRGVVRWRG